MKILFIATEFFKNTGNHTRALYEALVLYAGRDNVTPFLFPSVGSEKEKEYKDYIVNEHYTGLKKAINTIQTGDPLVSVNVESRLINVLKCNVFDIVFLSRSTLGCLYDIIRKYSDAKIVSNNMDVYIDYMKGKWHGNKLLFLRNSVVYYNWAKNDKKVALGADASIVLNERDKRGFVKYYKRNPDLILPLFCVDKLKKQDIVKTINKHKIILLFVGSLFWPNVEGIKWFIKNVMNKLPNEVELQIVGNKMESLSNQEEFNNEHVKLIGSVEATEPYYLNADVVVAPIFGGTGMKNKTAEALMYGKEFLATPEALEGYVDLDSHCCRTADDFIRKIVEFTKERPSKYNEYLRLVYEQNYSIEAVSGKLGALLESLV